MKVFERFGHVNFVDDFGVIVGYYTEQYCCETAVWFFTANAGEALYGEHPEPDDLALSPYRFDRGYFSKVGDVLETNAVIFRLTADARPDLFLVLRNTHNGYYSHGFDATVDGQPWQSGSV